MRVSLLLVLSGLAGALLFLGCQQIPAPRAADSLPPAPDLGLHAYTFRRYNYLETLDKSRELGIRYLQLYPGQRLGAEPEPKVHHQLDEATRQWIREQAQARGITLLSYFIRRAQDEAEWRQAFSFAQAIGARELATAPPPDQLPLLDRLSRETGLIVSLYNTPTPSPYADPAVALAAIAPYGPNLRLSGDAGHWARSGFEPVAAFRQVAGKMFTAQVKDLQEHGVRRARDVPWGTGVSNISGQIAELRRQRFDGVVFIDYEYDSPALEDEVRQSIEYFQRAWATPTADLLAGRVIPPGHTSRPNDP